jgi:hypothetical protein
MTYGQAETKKLVFKTLMVENLGLQHSAGTDIDLKWRLRHVNKLCRLCLVFCCSLNQFLSASVKLVGLV